MELFNLEEFLKSGIFFSSSIENKIWCMYGALEEYQSNENLEYPYFYFSDFYFKNKNTFYKGKKFFEFTFDGFQTILKNSVGNVPDIKWEKFDNLYYQKQFDFIMKNIKSKEIKKGVPFSFLSGKSKIDSENKLFFIQNVVKNIKNNKCYLYGFWKNNEGVIGTSPELIFSQEYNNIYTIALAGTIKNEINVNKDNFINDPKIKNEHSFVIEGIKKAIKHFGNVDIGQTRLFELPYLLHLKTDIFLNFKTEFNYLKLVHTLHPTPAVGIYPKNDQFWLEESLLNTCKRKNFAAPFGLLLNKNKSFCICLIRGLQWDEFDKVQITAGGGVIEESNYQDELNEIKFKIHSIIKNLGLNNEF